MAKRLRPADVLRAVLESNSDSDLGSSSDVGGDSDENGSDREDRALRDAACDDAADDTPG